MKQQKPLSSKFNLSLGFIPAIVSILFSGFIAPATAICIGAGIGVLLCLCSLWNRKPHISPLLLYGTTGMLLLLSAMALLLKNGRPYMSFPFVLELCTLIPPFVLYSRRNVFLHRNASPARTCLQRQCAQAIEAAIVSARVVLLMGLLHLLLIVCAMLLSRPLGETARYILFHLAPPLVFIASILFNQFGIFYFNTVMGETRFLPVVNTKGEVVGKAIASDVADGKGGHLYPVVRIAVVSNGMLFLRRRTGCGLTERGKTDLPLEDYLDYGETLQEGAHRILRQALPDAPEEQLRFHLTYRFEDGSVNRLVYLYTLDLKDDSLLQGFTDGKLWTLRQVEHNLGQDFFSDNLEQEFEPLKTIIYTREKYKES